MTVRDTRTIVIKVAVEVPRSAVCRPRHVADEVRAALEVASESEHVPMLSAYPYVVAAEQGLPLARPRHAEEGRVIKESSVIDFGKLEGRISGATVTSAEVVGEHEDDSFLVVTFDNGVVLYADNPTAYQRAL